MTARLALLSRFRTPALGALVLVVGLLIGLNLASRSAPPPRPAALLWDDYIMAVATLYQRDGDLSAAQERLAKLATDNPASSVEALAAVYVPEGADGAVAAGALRNLAVALTGRSVPAAAAPAAASQAPVNADSAAGPRGVFRSQILWLAVCLLSLCTLGLNYLRRRPAQLAPVTQAAALDMGRAPAFAAIAPKVKAEGKPRPTWQSVRPVGAKVPEPRTPAAPVPAGQLSISFTYNGGVESLEAMTPIVDPLTGRPMAGCGMTNGPRAVGAADGYLGFLVWLHELGSREMPQTVGLLADGAGEHCHGEVSEWVDYARVDELVVARPGIIRTFETRRLRAAVSVVTVDQARVGRQRYRVLSHLEVRLDISFKEAPVARVPELVH